MAKIGRIKETPCKHGQFGHCLGCDAENTRMVRWSVRLGLATLRAVRWWETKMAPRFPGAQPSINKFEEEALELIKTPEDEEEAADVFIALVIYAFRKGWDLPVLVQAKMAVNEAREWGEPDANGAVRHVDCRLGGQHNKRGCSYLLPIESPTGDHYYYHGHGCPLQEVSRSSIEAAP